MVDPVAAGSLLRIDPVRWPPVRDTADENGLPALFRSLIVVVAAGDGEVVEVGRPTVSPAECVMDLGSARALAAAGEAAAAVAGKHGGALARRGQPAPVPEGDQAEVLVEHSGDEPGVGGHVQRGANRQGAAVMGGGLADALLQVEQVDGDDGLRGQPGMLPKVGGGQQSAPGLGEGVVGALRRRGGLSRRESVAVGQALVTVDRDRRAVGPGGPAVGGGWRAIEGGQHDLPDRATLRTEVAGQFETAPARLRRTDRCPTAASSRGAGPSGSR